MHLIGQRVRHAVHKGDVNVVSVTLGEGGVREEDESTRTDERRQGGRRGRETSIRGKTGKRRRKETMTEEERRKEGEMGGILRKEGMMSTRRERK